MAAYIDVTAKVNGTNCTYMRFTHGDECDPDVSCVLELESGIVCVILRNCGAEIQRLFDIGPTSQCRCKRS